MITISQLVSLVAVAFLWGVTNPLMGKGSRGIVGVEHPNPIIRFLAELEYLLINWKFVVPWLVNQCGSVLFYVTLSSTELSVAVPLANGLTFIFTCAAGQWLGEHPATSGTLAGMLCVLIGVALCLADKMTAVALDGSSEN